MSQLCFTTLSRLAGEVNKALVENSALIKELNNDVTEIKNKIKQQSSSRCAIYSDEDDSNNSDFENKATEANDTEEVKQIDFPIVAKEDFDDFNKLIDTDPKYRNKVMRRLQQLINKRDSINKNMTAMIKSYITRDLALMYVPSKLGRGENSKLIFKDTAFYKCLQEVMRKFFKNDSGNELSDKDILNSMAATIRNARDWGGGRLQRIQKSQELNKTT